MSVMAVTDDPVLLLITKIFNNIFSLIVSSCISDLGSVFFVFFLFVLLRTCPYQLSFSLFFKMFRIFI